LIEIPDFQKGVENLMKIIQDTPKEDFKSMKNECISRAHEFSLDAFQKKLKSSLQL
jgi:hypothetical protein